MFPCLSEARDAKSVNGLQMFLQRAATRVMLTKSFSSNVKYIQGLMVSRALYNLPGVTTQFAQLFLQLLKGMEYRNLLGESHVISYADAFLVMSYVEDLVETLECDMDLFSLHSYASLTAIVAAAHFGLKDCEIA